MKAIGILAGPRKGGSTDMVIDAVLEGLKDGGARVEKISLYDHDIKPCTGCCACEKSRACRIKDDHQKVLDMMEDADVVVFGSPTYFSNVTSVAKGFFDRSARFFEMTGMGPRRKKDKPSRVVLVTSCGVPFPFSHMMGVATGCLRAMKVFFGYMKVRVVPICAAGMLDPVKSRPGKRFLKKAYGIGRRVSA